METRQTLATEYDILSRNGRLQFDEVPAHIRENLNQKLEIRPYQTEALLRWLDYYETKRQDGQPLQLLFNMATGSGKTLLMAALIVDLYKRGYRNYIFFVDKTNIVEKTKDNFLNSGSNKYLFNSNISIDGQPVSIKQVDNFEGISKKDISILFTTAAGLHSRLNNPAENSITYEDLAENKMVLISDEAHHINAETKSSHSKTEQEAMRSWEYTVNNLFVGHSENVLIEFTATIDVTHPAIFNKYKDHILYQYDLRQFRQDCYSKDVLIYDVDAEIMNRALQAMVISQYRKKVALSNRILLKPVILFKSRTIIDSKNFYDAYVDKIANLKPSDINAFTARADGVLKKAFAYFDSQEIDIAGLVAELKNDFSVDRCIAVDTSNIEPETQLLLNHLEDSENEIRAVFAVDMLNEGWDVLNLFDIVRLYDTRDAHRGRPGNTTIAEAQLIGRGARYYPFEHNGEDKYKRKFDSDIDNDLRAVEQIHYHSAHNPKYIQEISQALRESGIMPEEATEQLLEMKPDFKHTKLWQDGLIWVNRRVKNENKDILSFSEKGLQQIYQVELPGGHSREVSPFDLTASNVPEELPERTTEIIKLEEFGTNVIRKALDRDQFFNFNNLQLQFGSIQSISEFISSKKYLGGTSVELTADIEDIKSLNPLQMLYIVERILDNVKAYISGEEIRYEGTETFDPIPFRDIVKERVKLKIATSDSPDREYGRSTYHSTGYRVDLHNCDWYIYSDNFGTSEEKSLVKTIEALMSDLEAKWDDIYLVRNERFIKLYGFDDGRVYEPDFLLFANDKKQGQLSWQIFIEPKGSQFIGSSGSFDDGGEGWKQKFLLEIKAKFKTSTLLEDNKYRVIGLPFYNERITKPDFVKELVELKG